jgi:peptidoglycan/xylan/chitin deacetylase (PgdA/CDA1 family)
VSPRWNWDFDEERARFRKARASPRRPLREREIRFRRRRLAAGAIVLSAVLALVLALHSGSHRRSEAPAGAGAGSGAQDPTPPDELREQSRAVAAVFGYTPVIREGGRRGRDVALTFDDGPGPYTPALLDVLERAHVRATFFAIGQAERYFSASTEREIRDGDVVGDHTENHRELAELSAHEQREELFEGILRVELAGAPRPVLFRPPEGGFNATTVRESHALKLLMVLWSSDTGDYLKPGRQAIVKRALAGAHPGAIILMHDAGGDRSQTVAALPTIIEKLRARGFQLVTVPQLLLDDPPPRGLPVPTSLNE